MSNMNIDTLIDLVRKKSQLWDRGNRFHGNRHVLDKCWRDIAAEMKEDEVKIRKKWKYLRDQFAVEFGKIPPAGCEDEVQSYEPRWRYYKQLQFLEEVVTPRVTTKNPKREGDSSDSQTSETGSPYSDAVTSRYNKRKLETKKHKRYSLKTKLKRSDSVNEEHLHFFKSLLPHVRNIPPHLQLSFRNKIQEVVEEFAYKMDTTETIKEPYFITCVPDHAKSEPLEAVDESTEPRQDDLFLG